MVQRRILLSALLVVLLAMAAVPAQAGVFQKTFLLEANATYEVSVYIQADLEGAPALASVYIHNEHGEYLRSTKLSRGVPARNGGWHKVSVTVATPTGAQRATVMITTEDDIELSWDDFHIRRIEMSETLNGLEPDKVYTGLIVDARGMDLQRGMSPRIWSESGQLVYAGVVARQEFIQERGIASYGQELSPELVERLKSRGADTDVTPLVVTPLQITGNPENSVIISDADAAKILESLNHHDYLARYSVVFLVD